MLVSHTMHVIKSPDPWKHRAKISRKKDRLAGYMMCERSMGMSRSDFFRGSASSGILLHVPCRAYEDISCTVQYIAHPGKCR